MKSELVRNVSLRVMGELETWKLALCLRLINWRAGAANMSPLRGGRESILQFLRKEEIILMEDC
jgi:hypothetical protein